MLKNLFARFIGSIIFIDGLGHYIAFCQWIPDKTPPTPSKRNDKLLMTTGARLAFTGNNDLLTKFKRENKWLWRSERNATIFLFICLSLLLIVAILAK